MHEGDLDTVRAFISAVDSSDHQLEATRAIIEMLFAPDAEWHTMRELPGGGVRRGQDAVARELTEQWAIFDEFGVAIEDIRAVGEQVVTRLVMRTRPRGGGTEVKTRVGNVFTFREGRILRVRAFRDPDEAVAVADAEAAR